MAVCGLHSYLEYVLVDKKICQENQQWVLSQYHTIQLYIPKQMLSSKKIGSTFNSYQYMLKNSVSST